MKYKDIINTHVFCNSLAKGAAYNAGLVHISACVDARMHCHHIILERRCTWTFEAAQPRLHTHNHYNYTHTPRRKRTSGVVGLYTASDFCSGGSEGFELSLALQAAARVEPMRECRQAESAEGTAIRGSLKWTAARKAPKALFCIPTCSSKYDTSPHMAMHMGTWSVAGLSCSWWLVSSLMLLSEQLHMMQLIVCEAVRQSSWW